MNAAPLHTAMICASAVSVESVGPQRIGEGRSHRPHLSGEGAFADQVVLNHEFGQSTRPHSLSRECGVVRLCLVLGFIEQSPCHSIFR